MGEETKLWWTVAFALRGDALDWWVSWKVSNPNPPWWEFSKAILERFQPEVWGYVQDSESEEKTEIDDKSQGGERQELQERRAEEQDSREMGIVKPERKSRNRGKKAKQGNSQKWSKQNVDLALKVRGIAIKRRRKRAKKKRIKIKEERKGEEPEPPSTNLKSTSEDGSSDERRNVVPCIWAERPPPELPDDEKERFWVFNTFSMTGATPLRESEAETVADDENGNEIAEVKKRGSTVMVLSTAITNPTIKPSLTSSLFTDRDAKRRRTCMLPEPPDWGGVAVCVKFCSTKIRESGAAAKYIAGEKKKHKIMSMSQFHRLGQILGLMGQHHINMRLFKSKTIGSVFLFDVGYSQLLSKVIVKLTKSYQIGSKSHGNGSKLGSLSFKQWDPGIITLRTR